MAPEQWFAKMQMGTVKCKKSRYQVFLKGHVGAAKSKMVMYQVKAACRSVAKGCPGNLLACWRKETGLGPQPLAFGSNPGWVRVLTSRLTTSNELASGAFSTGIGASNRFHPSAKCKHGRRNTPQRDVPDPDRIDPDHIKQSFSYRRDRFATVTMASQQPLSSSQQPADVYGGGE